MKSPGEELGEVPGKLHLSGGWGKAWVRKRHRRRLADEEELVWGSTRAKCLCPSAESPHSLCAVRSQLRSLWEVHLKCPSVVPHSRFRLFHLFVLMASRASLSCHWSRLESCV